MSLQISGQMSPLRSEGNRGGPQLSNLVFAFGPRQLMKATTSIMRLCWTCRKTVFVAIAESFRGLFTLQPSLCEKLPAEELHSLSSGYRRPPIPSVTSASQLGDFSTHASIFGLSRRMTSVFQSFLGRTDLRIARISCARLLKRWENKVLAPDTYVAFGSEDEDRVSQNTGVDFTLPERRHLPKPLAACSRPQPYGPSEDQIQLSSPR